MPDRFLFHSDTNQQLFEDALDEAGLAHARTEKPGEVVVDAADGRDLPELACELGGDCS